MLAKKCALIYTRTGSRPRPSSDITGERALPTTRKDFLHGHFGSVPEDPSTRGAVRGRRTNHFRMPYQGSPRRGRGEKTQVGIPTTCALRSARVLRTRITVDRGSSTTTSLLPDTGQVHGP
jgi:hypothetical protein